jgi:hypothetical protein
MSADPPSDAFALHMDETIKKTREVCALANDVEIGFNKMGIGCSGRKLYTVEVPHDTYVSQEAIAEVIVHSSQFETKNPIRCVGIVVRKPPGEEWHEKLTADMCRWGEPKRSNSK